MGGRSRGVWRDPGAADISGVEIAAQNTTRPAKVQIVDIDGHRLRPRHGERIEGRPRLATPSWHRLAVDRWLP